MCVKFVPPGRKPCQLFFRAKQVVTEPGGEKFLAIALRKSNVQRLLAAYTALNPRRVDELFANTDVLDQLTKIKNEHVRNLIVVSKDSNAKQFRTTSKMYLENKLKLPGIIAIDCPSFGEVEGVHMRVLCTSATGKGHGLSVELQSKNFEYIGKALQYQHVHGGIDKKTRNKVKRARVRAKTR